MLERDRAMKEREIATKKERDSIYREERRKMRELNGLRGARVWGLRDCLDCFTENVRVKQLIVK